MRPMLLLLVSSLLTGAPAACDGPTRGGDADLDGAVDAASDADADADADADDGRDSALPCELDDALPPWPDWVPSWPGTGRNASGETTFRAFGDDATVTGLAVEEVTATSAIVAWSTPAEADSAVAWGEEPGVCPTGYGRTGGRIAHRMAVGPLRPSTSYHVVVRSRGDSSEGHGTIELTTPALPPATEIRECRAITEPGDYRLAADVAAGCTCIDVEVADVNLDLGFHTVTYAEDSTEDQCHGVLVQADDVRVSRGIVIQGEAGGGLYSHAVAGRSCTGLEVDQLWLYVHDRDAFGMRTMYASDVVVRDVIVVSAVQEVTDRHYPGNRGIGIDLPDDVARAEVYDCILFGVPHWGIMVTGGEPLAERPTTVPFRLIANNHIFADMHATNGYAIGVHGNHIEVHHNEIRPLWNGRAIHFTGSNAHIHHNIVEALERVAGDPDQGHASYSDLSDPASPHDAGVCSWVVAHGIRIEGGSFGLVDHNEVYVRSLADVTFGSTGINISTDAGARGGNEVHDNQVTAVRAEGSMLCNGGPLETTAGWAWGDPPAEPAELHDNRFASNGDALLIEDPALATSTNDELVSF